MLPFSPAAPPLAPSERRSAAAGHTLSAQPGAEVRLPNSRPMGGSSRRPSSRKTTAPKARVLQAGLQATPRSSARALPPPFPLPLPTEGWRWGPRPVASFPAAVPGPGVELATERLGGRLSSIPAALEPLPKGRDRPGCHTFLGAQGHRAPKVKEGRATFRGLAFQGCLAPGPEDGGLEASRPHLAAPAACQAHRLG